MLTRPVLVLDEQWQTAKTVGEALHPLGAAIDWVAGADDTLERLPNVAPKLALIAFDARDACGLDLLRRCRAVQPRLRIVLLVSREDVASSVKVIELGIVDAIVRPLTTTRVRALAAIIGAREVIDEARAADFNELVELAKRQITDREFDRARAMLTRAVVCCPTSAEAYDLLALLAELSDDAVAADRAQRAATRARAAEGRSD